MDPKERRRFVKLLRTTCHGRWDAAEEEMKTQARRARKYAHEGDDEGAHGSEDVAREMALMMIAAGHPEPQRIATRGLSTKNLKFSRWVA